MFKEKASQLLLFLLLADLLVCTFSIQSAAASGDIYIRADGSIDPSTAPIQRNVNVYTFTDNIDGNIIVQRDNVVINGAGHTLQGTGVETGMDLSSRTNVTIQNIVIETFYDAIYLNSSSQITISGTNVTDSTDGIRVSDSSNNSIYENNITGNSYEGIYILTSSNNTISENNITANTGDGVYFGDSSNNTIFENNISNNWWGITSVYSANNKIFHNNFIDNNPSQAYSEYSVDFWDAGYPSGGNYWNDYTGADTKKGPYQNITGPDGIGDTAYVIDANNIDNYPLSPSTQPSHDIAIFNSAQWKKVVCQGFPICTYGSTINYGNNSENVNIIAYANGVAFDSKNSTLQAKTWNTTGFTFTSSFGWNTTSLIKGVNYSLSFYALPILGETDTSDNNFADGWVFISRVGDLTGGTPGVPDGKVDIRDIAYVAKAFGSIPGTAGWNADCDVNNDGKVDIRDIAIVAKHFGEAG